ncbi:MAG TPA: hypothetical protein PKV66_00200 [Candidatus Pelethenecus sp.]|jgi:hypothetical protein|nr:hypothetical protein [Candidatus Pelethenecus sp.]
MPRPKKVVETTNEEVSQNVNSQVDDSVTETNPKVTLESIPLSNEARINYMTVLNAYRMKNPAKFEQKREYFIKKMLSL